MLCAPARTATPASPKAARLSPVAVSQALRTSKSIASGERWFLVRSKLSKSLTLIGPSAARINVFWAEELN